MQHYRSKRSRAPYLLGALIAVLVLSAAGLMFYQPPMAQEKVEKTLPSLQFTAPSANARPQG